jgi:hypothetical protein
MMTWGQRSIWHSIQWLNGEDHYFNISRVLPVPPGRRFADVADALAVIGARHQTLRAVYPVTPTGPRQFIAGTATMTVPVAQSDEASARPAADALAVELAARSFGADELPWRCALVAAGAVPLFLVLVFSHQGADGWAVRLVTAQLAEVLAGNDEAGAGLPWQPLDQVGYETSGDGPKRSAASLRYWRGQLGSIPRTMFDFPRQPPDTPRFWRLGMDSPAVAVAASLIAGRLGVSVSAVLLAASAAVLTALNGHDRCVMKLIVANRFDDTRRSLVAPMAEDGLFVLPADIPDFDALVRFTYRSALLAYRYGYYDPVQLADLLGEVGVARGGPADLAAFFNDTRFQDRWDALPQTPVTSAGWSALTGRTTIRVLGSWARQDAKLFVTAAYASGSCVLQLLADTVFVPVDGARLLLRGMESLLVASVAEPTQLADVPAVSGVQPVARGPGWALADGIWTDTAALELMLQQAAGCPQAAVFSEPTGSADGRQRLVAFAREAPGLTARGLRAACGTAVADRSDVIAPQRYVICEHAPRDIRDLASWLAMPVIDAAER